MLVPTKAWRAVRMKALSQLTMTDPTGGMPIMLTALLWVVFMDRLAITTPRRLITVTPKRPSLLQEKARYVSVVSVASMVNRFATGSSEVLRLR